DGVAAGFCGTCLWPPGGAAFSGAKRVRPGCHPRLTPGVEEPLMSGAVVPFPTPFEALSDRDVEVGLLARTSTTRRSHRTGTATPSRSSSARPRRVRRGPASPQAGYAAHATALLGGAPDATTHPRDLPHPPDHSQPRQRRGDRTRQPAAGSTGVAPHGTHPRREPAAR